MYQKVEIIGRLGQDVTSSVTNSGKSVCNFSVATYFGSGDKKETEWWRVVAWNKLAENCVQYIQKGSLVHVTGTLKTNKYQDKEGNERESKDLIAQEVTFLDSKKERNNNPPQSNDKPQSPTSRDRPF